MNLLLSPEQEELVRTLERLCGEEDPAVRQDAARKIGLFDDGALAPDDQAIAFRILGHHLAPITWLATALAAPLGPPGAVALAEPHSPGTWRILGEPAEATTGWRDGEPTTGAGGATFELRDGSGERSRQAGPTSLLAVGPSETKLLSFSGPRCPTVGHLGPENVEGVASSQSGHWPPRPGFDPGTGIALIAAEDLERADTIARAHSEPVLRRGSLLVAALLAGSAEASLQRSVEHVRQREQFGRPIGSFQAVAHRCADMAIRAEGATAAVHLAAASVGAMADDADTTVAAARLVAADAALRNAAEDIQHHGALGFTAEIDCHRHLKRAHLLERTLGSPETHVSTLTERLARS